MRRITASLILLFCLGTISAAQDKKTRSNPQDIPPCQPGTLSATGNLPSTGGTWTATWTYYLPSGGYCGQPGLQTNVPWVTPNNNLTQCKQASGHYTCTTPYTVAANTGPTRSGQLFVPIGNGEDGPVTITQSGPPEILTVHLTGNGQVKSSPSGIKCPGTCSVAFSYGDQVTLTATPSSGYVFTGWSGACSGTGTCTLTMYSNADVTATFTAVETLTVSITGSGIVTSTDGYINCPGTCSHGYSPNTPVSLNASPASGWIFNGWSGACTGTGSCNLTMAQSLSVSATFVQNHTLTVTTSGSGNVSSTDGYINCPGTCSHTYPYNTLVTLNANPAQGWSLTAWGGACSGKGSSCNLRMTQNQLVSATFNHPMPSASISWILPAELSWGPPGTLTAAGYALNGSGGVQLVWRDATVNGSWNTVAYEPTPSPKDGSWSNTIPAPIYHCDTYQAYVNYSGIRSTTYSYNASYLFANQSIYPNHSIYSCDGRFQFTLQLDGNLVVYQGTIALWASNTGGKGSAVAVMQADGNFVIYDAENNPIWASNTPDYQGAYLVVQNDGNVVIYYNNQPIWATNTCCH